MRVICTRHSVSAGDDVAAPNRRSFDFREGADLPELLSAISNSGWLPSVAGGCATWSAVSGRPVAVLAQEWAEPRILPLIAMETLDWRVGALFLHFNYHGQIDPEVVHRVFWGMQLRA